ncbi:MAG: hypothetical protein ABR981_01530 [Candidatus Micrarchaeaceae archaeon]|jgi:hypothetical protein
MTNHDNLSRRAKTIHSTLDNSKLVLGIFTVSGEQSRLSIRMGQGPNGASGTFSVEGAESMNNFLNNFLRQGSEFKLIILSERLSERTARLIQNKANLLECYLDEDILRNIKTRRVLFIDYCDAPKEVGWYFVDKNNKTFQSISEAEYNELAWNERLYVYPQASKAIEEKRPLVFGYTCTRTTLQNGVLFLGDNFNTDDAAQVVLKLSS